MKIVIIGLGDIAQKAYLPVIATRSDVVPMLCTRNSAVMKELQMRYRIPHAVASMDDLLASPVMPQAAFVHTSTDSHPEIVSRLLNAGIDVYVDKPLAYNFHDAEQLCNLAERKQRILMVGFNRRFAPMVACLKAAESPPEMILMQKNRRPLPDAPRRFVFDDFIHVVDTLRFLMNDEAERVEVSARVGNGLLQRVLLQLESPACTALGIMNRNSGAVEERLEVSRADDKSIVENLSATTRFQAGEEKRMLFGDWESTLHRRGFPQIISHFIDCVSTRATPSISLADALKTHEICERVVAEIAGQRGFEN